MKQILLFLLFKFSLFSQVLYLLPDDYDNVIQHLSHQIERAEDTILIITEEFNNYTLKKSLIKASIRGVAITLISSKDDQKSHLALYKNIDSREIIPLESSRREGKITMSIIIIDASLTCKLSTALETTHIKHDTAIFTCNNNTNYIHALRETLSPLIQRSTPYLAN